LLLLYLGCPICLESLQHRPLTAVTCCKHCKQVFCNTCLDKALKYKPYCPACTLPLRKITGNQPKGGTMTSYTTRHLSLPGYEKYGTITINYFIPSGTQGPEHPNPGQRFYGTTRTAYLPDSPEGRKVSQLLKKAFDARLVFTIGTSHTTGASNTVVWNDIHHKTNKMGGPQRLLLYSINDVVSFCIIHFHHTILVLKTSLFTLKNIFLDKTVPLKLTYLCC